jgi:hypothetical protein
MGFNLEGDRLMGIWTLIEKGSYIWDMGTGGYENRSSNQ